MSFKPKSSGSVIKNFCYILERWLPQSSSLSLVPAGRQLIWIEIRGTIASHSSLTNCLSSFKDHALTQVDELRIYKLLSWRWISPREIYRATKQICSEEKRSVVPWSGGGALFCAAQKQEREYQEKIQEGEKKSWTIQRQFENSRSFHEHSRVQDETAANHWPLRKLFLARVWVTKLRGVQQTVGFIVREVCKQR